MTFPEPTATEALDEARADIAHWRIAASAHDEAQRMRFAEAATTLLDPTASVREVVAARFYLAEGRALDGRRNGCGADTIHTSEEAHVLLDDADRRWLDNYLANRTLSHAVGSDYSLGR
jgi:hypothetical protein